MADNLSEAPEDDAAASPGPMPFPVEGRATPPHRGVLMTGEDGADGPEAFYIHVETLPGKEEQVEQMLRDILACVQEEPATGPRYGVRYSETTFGIFQAFLNIAGWQAHVDGGGGDIFRDVERILGIPHTSTRSMSSSPKKCSQKN
jgi:hypothetical protein